MATQKTTSTTKKTVTTRKDAASIGNLFEKDNFLWMIIGAAVLILGFLLMAGGGSNDPNVFDANQVYSFRRITLAPIVILLGFAIEIYAIFRKPKSR